MATYIILSRFSPQAFEDPKDIRKLAERVSTKIKSECPGVKWKESYATMGGVDVVDVVEAGDPKEVSRAAMIIHGHGRCTTETMHATPWKEFLASL
ncbi:MAG: GYD domain-containing protein [Gemmatimonadales bacterium]